MYIIYICIIYIYILSINFVWRDCRVSRVNPMNLCILSIQLVKLKEKVFLVIVSFCLS